MRAGIAGIEPTYPVLETGALTTELNSQGGKMATHEQRIASGGVMAAVTALNRALRDAGSAGLFVELVDVRLVGSRVATYNVSAIETRETVMPPPPPSPE